MIKRHQRQGRGLGRGTETPSTYLFCISEDRLHLEWVWRAVSSPREKEDGQLEKCTEKAVGYAFEAQTRLMPPWGELVTEQGRHLLLERKRQETGSQ